MRLKTAVFAPIPRASVRTATAVKARSAEGRRSAPKAMRVRRLASIESWNGGALYTIARFLPGPLHVTPAASEIKGVKHITLQTDDIPAPVIVDRRHNPDRRKLWRGGRRDSDWHQRPSGAWARMEAEPAGRWQRVLASLHLW